MNLVSDEEELIQPEKPEEEKNTTSNSKDVEYNGGSMPQLNEVNQKRYKI